MRPTLHRSLSILAAAAAAMPLAGASDTTGPRLAPWRHAAGIGECAGRLFAAGPDYKAELSSGGIRFTPALGEHVATNRELVLSARAVRRGGARVELAEAPFTPIGPSAAERRLADLVRERVEALPAGLEMSFELAELPGSGGDLVVELELSGNLPAPRDGESTEGLRFADPDYGGVRIGSVTGIDADGARAAGSLRWSGGLLELVLPASFVDSARLPLLVDPLIGPEIVVTLPAMNDADPDVAYEPSADRYFFAWERRFSAADVDVVGARITGSGVLVDGIVPLEADGAVLALNPTVCSVRTAQHFLAVWQRGTGLLGPFQLEAASVAAATGAIGGTALLPTAGSALDPDAGGDSSASVLFPFAQNRAIVVYQEQGEGIRCTSAFVSSSGEVTPQGTVALDLGQFPTKPVISKGCGAAGRYLVAWQVLSSTLPGASHFLSCALVDRSGAVLVPEGLLTTVFGGPEDDTNVNLDGDGSSFLLVWERDDLSNGPGDRDLLHRMIAVSDTTISPGTISTMILSAGSDERDPAVALCGPKYVVAFADQDSFLDYRLRLLALDPKTCAPCETGYDEVALETDSDTVGSIELCSRFSSGSSSDQALLVWDSVSLAPPFPGGIHAQRVEALGAGGPITNLGGGCNIPPNLKFDGPFAVGNSGLAISLTEAPPTAVFGLLLLALPGPAPTPCGGCSIVAGPAAGYFATGLSGGEGSVSTPIPCKLNLAGKSFDFQWIAYPGPPGACSLTPFYSFSDIHRATVGF